MKTVPIYFNGFGQARSVFSAAGTSGRRSSKIGRRLTSHNEGSVSRLSDRSIKSDGYRSGRGRCEQSCRGAAGSVLSFNIQNLYTGCEALDVLPHGSCGRRFSARTRRGRCVGTSSIRRQGRTVKVG